MSKISKPSKKNITSKSTPFLIILAVLFGLLVPSSVQTATASNKEPRKIVTGWIPYYSIDRVLPRVRKLTSSIPAGANQPAVCDSSQYGPTENAAIENSYLFRNKDLMKEVLPFWFSLKSPTLIRNDYITGNPSWPMDDTVCLMRRAGMQIIPSMTDGTAKLVLAGYLANPTTRTTIVNSIVNLVNVNGFDGIDLDYEGFAFVDGSSTWTRTAPLWVAFIKELSVALRAKGKLLSVTTPYLYDPSERQKGYFVYAWSDIASSIDRLRIMTYDFNVAKPGPNAPISWVDKTVRYAISIMPSSKVYLGLPGYGRDWITAVQGKCPVSAPPGLKAGAKAATFLMVNAERKAAIDNAIPVFDATVSEATYSYTQTYNGLTADGASTSCTVNRTVWYQNSRSYAERMALVSKYRLGGAALWTLGMEDQLATTEMRNAALAMAPDVVVSTMNLTGLNKGSIFYADQFTVNGLFTLKDKSPIAGLPVSVEINRGGTWTKVAEFLTDATGAITVPMVLANPAGIRLTTLATWERTESITPEQLVDVKSKILIDRPNSAPRSSTFTVRAQLLPQVAGKSAVLQKSVNGKWQNVGTPLISDASGVFSFNSVENSRGILTLRVQVGTDITSETFAIIIR
uniref:glycosyl hydrolase family 18 protein n=1 Tax=Candidatus Planktophila sp. TaxID=2175601 RepID=UPI004048F5AB